MTTLLRLGLDPGNGAIKVWGPAGGLQLPASVAVSAGRTLSRAVGLATVKPPLHLRTGAGAFYLGLGAHDWGRPVENMDHERFTGTPELRALVYGALGQYQALAAAKAAVEPAVQADGAAPAEDPELSLTVGLPIETLSGDEEGVKATVANTRRWLEGGHAWEADDRPYAVTVQNVAITSQPVGALFDFLLAEDGSFIPARKALFRAEIGVVAIGMNSIEMLVTRGGQVVPGDTYGDRRGVRRLLELCNPQNLFSLSELDAQLRAGKLDVSQALPIWAAEVSGLLERRWGAKHRRFAAVILAGGGAQLLGQQLAGRFAGKAQLPDDPVLAIARGLFKLACANAHKKS